jgi:hypothetical protein
MTKISTVTLSNPLKIDGKDETIFTVRKPKAGELRGLKLIDLMQMDVSAMIVALPRITQPPLSPEQVSGLDLADFTKFGTKIVGFFGDPTTPDPETPQH